MSHGDDDEPLIGAGPWKTMPRGNEFPRYAVSDLLCGGREAVLEHDGAVYRLRITSNGRLILTK
jgi:hemin uptake protein HemP